MEVKVVKLTRIDDARIEPSKELVQSLKHVGQLSPVILQSCGLGFKHKIIDGRRRVAALRLLGGDTVHAIILDEGTDGIEQYEMSLVSNLVRSPSPILEMLLIAKLFEAGRDEDYIVEHLGIPKYRVRQRMKLERLVPALRRRVLDRKMSVATAMQAAKLTVTEQQILASYEGRISMSWVKAVQRQEQLKLLDLDSIEVPTLATQDQSLDMESLAMTLTHIAQRHQGAKRQVLLEAAAILEQESNK